MPLRDFQSWNYKTCVHSNKASGTAVLSSGDLALLGPGEIRQYLETVLNVMTVTWWVEARDAANAGQPPIAKNYSV